jgi:hypothetical protein
MREARYIRSKKGRINLNVIWCRAHE